MQNAITVHRATLRPASWCHCDYARLNVEQKPHSEMDSKKGYNGANNGTDKMYVADKIVRHISSEPCLRYAVRWGAYTEADGTAERTTHTPQHFIEEY